MPAAFSILFKVLFVFTCLNKTLASSQCFNNGKIPECKNEKIRADYIKTANDVYCYMIQNQNSTLTLKEITSALEEDQIFKIEKSIEAAWLAIHQKGQNHDGNESKLQRLVVQKIVKTGFLSKVTNSLYSREDPICYIRPLLKTDCPNSLNHFIKIFPRGRKYHNDPRIPKLLNDLKEDIEGIEPINVNCSITMILGELLKRAVLSNKKNELKDVISILEKKLESIMNYYLESAKKGNFEHLNMFIEFSFQFGGISLESLLDDLTLEQLEELKRERSEYFQEKLVCFQENATEISRFIQMGILKKLEKKIFKD